MLPPYKIKMLLERKKGRTDPKSMQRKVSATGVSGVISSIIRVNMKTKPGNSCKASSRYLAQSIAVNILKLEEL